jgi:hypothetical protein
MKRISSHEAKHIVLTYLMGFVTSSMSDDCDFYEEIPESYILDKDKLESILMERLGIYESAYYPDKKDIKIICKEFEKIFRQLLRQQKTAIKRYEKTQN